jgi:hypothetical protein
LLSLDNTWARLRNSVEPAIIVASGRRIMCHQVSISSVFRIVVT